MSKLVEEFARYRGLFRGPVQIRVHEKKSSYLSVRKSRGTLCVEVHKLFEEAPSPVLEALVRYCLRGDRTALVPIKQMASLYFNEQRIQPKKLKRKGEHYDLAEIYERVKAAFFDPSFEADIGWSERKWRGKLRSVTFGCYDRQAGQIRIHPLLDNPQVPLYFLEFIVYHEMLHAVCKPEIDSAGRAKVHTEEFRKREREHPFFAAAKRWEKREESWRDIASGRTQSTEKSGPIRKKGKFSAGS